MYVVALVDAGIVVVCVGSLGRAEGTAERLLGGSCSCQTLALIWHTRNEVWY